MIQLTGDVAVVSGAMTMTAATALLEEGCDAIDDDA